MAWAAVPPAARVEREPQAQAREIAARQAAFEKHEEARQRLAGQPDDAAAHLAIGAYRCFHKQDWKAGLPHLARGADPLLKEAAQRELKDPKEAEAQADLGDLWWQQAEKESSPVKEVLQRRATFWYTEALVGLPPARHAVVLKRLQAGFGSMGAAIEKLKASGLAFCVAPGADPTGKARELLTLTPPTHVGTVTEAMDAGVKALKFANGYASYPASDAVRAIQAVGSYVVWIKHAQSVGPWAGVIFRGTAPDPKVGRGVTDFSLFLYQDRFRLSLNWPDNEWPGVDGKTTFISKSPVPVGQWTMCGVTWNGSAIVLYLDGQRDRAFESTMTPLARKFPVQVALGCDPAGSPEFYNGLLSCAMIFDRALTDAEVKQLHALAGPLGWVGPKE